MSEFNRDFGNLQHEESSEQSSLPAHDSASADAQSHELSRMMFGTQRSKDEERRELTAKLSLHLGIVPTDPREQKAALQRLMTQSFRWIGEVADGKKKPDPKVANAYILDLDQFRETPAGRQLHSQIGNCQERLGYWGAKGVHKSQRTHAWALGGEPIAVQSTATMLESLASRPGESGVVSCEAHLKADLIAFRGEIEGGLSFSYQMLDTGETLLSFDGAVGGKLGVRVGAATAEVGGGVGYRFNSHSAAARVVVDRVVAMKEWLKELPAVPDFLVDEFIPLANDGFDPSTVKPGVMTQDLRVGGSAGVFLQKNDGQRQQRRSSRSGRARGKKADTIASVGMSGTSREFVVGGKTRPEKGSILTANISLGAKVEAFGVKIFVNGDLGCEKIEGDVNPDNNGNYVSAELVVGLDVGSFLALLRRNPKLVNAAALGWGNDLSALEPVRESLNTQLEAVKMPGLTETAWEDFAKPLATRIGMLIKLGRNMLKITNIQQDFAINAMWAGEDRDDDDELNLLYVRASDTTTVSLNPSPHKSDVDLSAGGWSEIGMVGPTYGLEAGVSTSLSETDVHAEYIGRDTLIYAKGIYKADPTPKEAKGNWQRFLDRHQEALEEIIYNTIWDGGEGPTLSSTGEGYEPLFQQILADMGDRRDASRDAVLAQIHLGMESCYLMMLEKAMSEERVSEEKDKERPQWNN